MFQVGQVFIQYFGESVTGRLLPFLPAIQVHGDATVFRRSNGPAEAESWEAIPPGWGEVRRCLQILNCRCFREIAGDSSVGILSSRLISLRSPQISLCGAKPSDEGGGEANLQGRPKNNSKDTCFHAKMCVGQCLIDGTRELRRNRMYGRRQRRGPAGQPDRAASLPVRQRCEHRKPNTHNDFVSIPPDESPHDWRDLNAAMSRNNPTDTAALPTTVSFKYRPVGGYLSQKNDAKYSGKKPDWLHFAEVATVIHQSPDAMGVRYFRHEINARWAPVFVSDQGDRLLRFPGGRSNWGEGSALMRETRRG
jgi:hypothetical protein